MAQAITVDHAQPTAAHQQVESPVQAQAARDFQSAPGNHLAIAPHQFDMPSPVPQLP